VRAGLEAFAALCKDFVAGALRIWPGSAQSHAPKSERSEKVWGGNENMTRLSSRFLAVMAVVGVAIAASLVGGVGVGHASTSFDVTNKALIGTSGNEVPEVSWGGKIGFEATVQNTNTSNATHVEFVVQVPGGSFVDATDPSCAALKGDPSTMVCIPFGGTMNAGGPVYTVDYRFTAPTSGASVTVIAGVSIAAKTQGNPLNNGTLVKAADPVTVALNTGGDQNDTFLRKNEGASAGGPQNFSANLPAALLGNPFGLELGIHNQNGQVCPTCIGTFSDLTIPAASDVLNVGNPFYDATTLPLPTFNPYGWTMSATVATSFKLNGVFHIDDAGNGGTTPIPSCASLGGGPTVASPLCWDTLTSKNKAGVQNLNATGHGLENGKITFGS
jgi:hypothetical protein